MIDFDYLYKGVCGLARAHKAGTMAGHLGAAVVAGYFFSEQQSDLPSQVFQGITEELERIIAGEEAIWFNAQKAGVTPTELFGALPDSEPVPSSIGSIANALAENVNSLKQSGHNIIFASLALRALQDHEELCTRESVSGIRKLIEAFNSVSAGRGYFGKQKGWLQGKQVTLTDDSDFPSYENIEQMAITTLHELIASSKMKRQGFGGLWHIINHAAAIVELNRFGHHELAQRALPAHHEHVRLWRSLPDVESELGKVEKSAHDPREPSYWSGELKRDQARLTHRIKTLYGYYTLRDFLEKQEQRDQADDAFLYLMA